MPFPSAGFAAGRLGKPLWKKVAAGAMLFFLRSKVDKGLTDRISRMTAPTYYNDSGISSAASPMTALGEILSIW